MRYIFFAEGLTILLAGYYLAHQFGTAGVLASALAANILWSGIYGLYRSSIYFHSPVRDIWRAGMAGPMRLLYIWVPLLFLAMMGRHYFKNPAVTALLLAGLGAAAVYLLYSRGVPASIRQKLDQTLAEFLPGVGLAKHG